MCSFGQSDTDVSKAALATMKLADVAITSSRDLEEQLHSFMGTQREHVVKAALVLGLSALESAV
jgi:hypothetical protein